MADDNSSSSSTSSEPDAAESQITKNQKRKQRRRRTTANKKPREDNPQALVGPAGDGGDTNPTGVVRKPLTAHWLLLTLQQVVVSPKLSGGLSKETDKVRLLS